MDHHPAMPPDHRGDDPICGQPWSAHGDIAGGAPMHCPTTDQLDPDLINTRLDSTGSETVADRVTPDDQLLPCTYLDGYCAHCDDLV